MITEDRDVYLAKCKKRALEYLDRGEVANAIVSISSDLSKHEDFKGVAEKMMPVGLFFAMSNDAIEARRFIVGFR
jgi:hypothetical protein